MNTRRRIVAATLYTLICAGIMTCSSSAQEPETRRSDALGALKKAGSIPVLDVCDALQRIDQLDGKVIAVRGYYRFGKELGGLYGRNCPKKLILDRAERAQAFDLRLVPV